MHQGQFKVQAGGALGFKDLLVLVAIEANSLPGDFSFTLAGRTFDPNADFGFYDAAGNDTGRPTGYYSVTNPKGEPVAYDSSAGMVTIMDLSGLSLTSANPLTINYAFTDLPAKAVFSVYGEVTGKNYIYHTNRGLLDLNDGTSVVSTFEVVPEPCSLVMLAAGALALFRRRR